MDLLWTSFLNSEWHDWRGSGKSEDRLDKPGWLAKFLTEWHLPVPPATTAEDIADLKELRSRLLTMAKTLAGGGSVPVEELNEFLAGGPVLRHVGPDHRLTLVPVGQGWEQVKAEIAASLARTLAEGEGARVRICDNPDCLWVFYDDTRNRTKRYCDDKLCGNLMKVRRFRAKRQNES